MAQHLVTFHLDDPALGAHAPLHPVHMPTGTLLTEAAHAAGVEIAQPCGGQGRCGRCAVHITKGEVRRRSTLRLSAEDVAAGYAWCQSAVESDVSVIVPPQEKIERRLTTDRVVADVAVPIDYDARSMQTIQGVSLALTPPSLEDQTDDWSRLVTALRQQQDVEEVDVHCLSARSAQSCAKRGMTRCFDSASPSAFRSACSICVLPKHLSSAWRSILARQPFRVGWSI
jgi:ferredoxin